MIQWTQVDINHYTVVHNEVTWTFVCEPTDTYFNFFLTDGTITCTIINQGGMIRALDMASAFICGDSNLGE